MADTSTSSRVLIVGAGPTGLVLACELARRGIAGRIIDAAAGPETSSRAKGLSPRSLEVLDGLGVVGRVLAGGRSRMPLLRWQGHRRLGSRELNGEVQENATRPYPRTVLVAQPRVEQALRELLDGPGVTVEWGTALRGLTPEFGDAPTLDQVRTLIADWTGRHDIRIRSASWLSIRRSNVRMVDRCRAGRAFLAGDAARVHPAAGGLGMNTGMQDAYNLGWKLAAGIDGTAADSLRLFDLFRGPHVAAPGFGTPTAELPKRLLGIEVRHAVVQEKGGPDLPTGPGILRAQDGSIHAAYAARTGTTVLARPDGRVLSRAASPDAEALSAHLAAFATSV